MKNHEFKEGDCFEPSSVEKGNEFLRKAEEAGYNVHNSSFDDEQYIEFWSCNELGFIACDCANPNYTEEEMFAFITSKYEFTRGEGVVTSDIFETLRLLQIAHKNEYPVYHGSLDVTIYSAFYWDGNEFVGCTEYLVEKVMLKERFLEIMNQKSEPMDTNNTIIYAPAELLRLAYKEATPPQLKQLKLTVDPYTGAVTKANVRILYGMCCSIWKTKLEVEYPWLKKKEVKLNVVTHAEDDFYFKINGKDAFAVFKTESEGNGYIGKDVSGHMASIYLTDSSNGQWYTQEGNKVNGYFYWKPKNYNNKHLKP